jgi:hypothetical protein
MLWYVRKATYSSPYNAITTIPNIKAIKGNRK